MACVVFSQILSCLLFMSSGDLEICVPAKKGCITPPWEVCIALRRSVRSVEGSGGGLSD